MSRFVEDKDLAISFRNLRLSESFESSIQKIELFEHPALGKILVIDGEVQHVERWQALYHEPLVHLPAAFVPEITNVLILGGGSLFAALEVLRYPTIERCTLVDHDPSVLNLMVRHYRHAQKVINDRRFVFVTSSALEFLEKSDSQYDLLLNDCFDTVRLSEDSGISVFRLMTDRLSACGVCADPIYRHVFERHHISQTQGTLKAVNYAISLITVPEYPGVLHLLACWGNDCISQHLRVPINDCQKAWIKKSGAPKLEFYDPKFLSFHLYLPPYLKGLWKPSFDKCMTES